MKLFSLVLSVSIILMSGCALKTTPDPDLIHKFELNEPKAKADETIVYVINQTPTIHIMHASTFVGVNDNSYLQEQSAYSRFVLKNKINTISLTQPHSGLLINSASSEGYYPQIYKTIDNRLGETIFLSYLHTIRDTNLTEIDKDLGMTLCMQAKKVNISDEHPAYGHQIALMNPSTVKVNLMQKDISRVNLDKDKARIVFYRVENFDSWKSLGLGIWSKTGFIGSLKGEEFLSVDVEPGKHEFATKYGAWSILDTTVEANKTYYVEVFAVWGWDEVYTKLIAKKSTTSIGEIEQEMINFEKVILNKSVINELAELRLDTALPYVRNAINNRKSVKIEYEDSLQISDGK